MNTQRTLAVAAAVLFVGAVALATSGTEMMSLGGALAWFGANTEANLHAWIVRVMGPWAWKFIAEPLLIRPAWLPFGSLGLILAGLSFSWPAGDQARRSHRRS